MPQFEVFKGRDSRAGTEPLVTMQRGGIYSLNQAAHEALGRPEFVELLFDRNDRVMGFRNVPRGVTHAYKVRGQANSSSFLVTGRAFNQYFGITVDKARRYPVTMIDDVMAVDLKSGESVQRQSRMKAGGA